MLLFLAKTLKAINPLDIMDSQTRFNLITRNAEEVLIPEDLKWMLESGVELKHYIGFEISGKAHLGSAIISAMKIKDLLDAGVQCNIFLADWHSWINNKLGGDIDKIKAVGVPFFKEMLIAGMKCVGVNPEKVNFVLGSELYHNNDNYWLDVVDVSKHLTLHRVMRSITIAGRKEGEAVNFATLIYPPMQVADIFTQSINIAHAGMDQRSAHVIARDVALRLRKPLTFKGKPYKPIAIHHPLLQGLMAPPKWPISKQELQQVMSELKMSKSKPESAIFITDTVEDIKRKIKKAFCPEKDLSYNPIVQWARLLVFNNSKVLEVNRPRKFGGNVVYETFEQLSSDFKSGKLHPLDLKSAMADFIIKLTEPARKHFEKPRIKKLRQEFEKLAVTR